MWLEATTMSSPQSAHGASRTNKNSDTGLGGAVAGIAKCHAGRLKSDVTATPSRGLGGRRGGPGW
jgi:hypothetical protein